MTETVLPALQDALAFARAKRDDLMDSDAAHEARRRGFAIVKAARGEPDLPPPSRWRFAVGMLALGAAIGAGCAWLARRLTAPVETYRYQPALPDGSPIRASDDIDLRAGAPTAT